MILSFALFKSPYDIDVRFENEPGKLTFAIVNVLPKTYNSELLTIIVLARIVCPIFAEVISLQNTKVLAFV